MHPIAEAKEKEEGDGRCATPNTDIYLAQLISKQQKEEQG